jgi:hypothetical protein
MSSAVHDLQKAISDGNQPLVQLLRQTKLIAAKLNLQDVETWVGHRTAAVSARHVVTSTDLSPDVRLEVRWEFFYDASHLGTDC